MKKTLHRFYQNILLISASTSQPTFRKKSLVRSMWNDRKSDTNNAINLISSILFYYKCRVLSKAIKVNKNVVSDYLNDVEMWHLWYSGFARLAGKLHSRSCIPERLRQATNEKKTLTGIIVYFICQRNVLRAYTYIISLICKEKQKQPSARSNRSSRQITEQYYFFFLFLIVKFFFFFSFSSQSSAILLTETLFSSCKEQFIAIVISNGQSGFRVGLMACSAQLESTCQRQSVTFCLPVEKKKKSFIMRPAVNKWEIAGSCSSNVRGRIRVFIS